MNDLRWDVYHTRFAAPETFVIGKFLFQCIKLSNSVNSVVHMLVYTYHLCFRILNNGTCK